MLGNKEKQTMALLLLAFVCMGVNAYECTKVSGDCTVGSPVYANDSSVSDKLTVVVNGDAADDVGTCIFWCTVNRSKGNVTYGNFTGNWSDASTWDYNYFCNHGVVCNTSVDCGLYYHSGTNHSVKAYDSVADGGCNVSTYSYLSGTSDITLVIQKGTTTGGSSSYPPFKMGVTLALLSATAQMLVWWKTKRS